MLSNIYYDKLRFNRSLEGHSGIYELDIAVLIQTAINIPGTQLDLLINPGSNSALASFPTVLQYRWEILKYSDAFSLSSFSDTAQSVFSLFMDLSGATAEELLAELMQFIPSTDPL